MATDRPADTSAKHAALQSRAQYAAMLRGSALPTLAVGALCVIGAAFVGARAAWSAGLGAALVLVFFSLSLLVMRNTAHWSPTAVMGAVLASYTAKIIVLAVVLIGLGDVSWLSGQALALTIIGCTIVWLACEMRAFTRIRILVAPGADVDVDADRDAEVGER